MRKIIGKGSRLFWFTFSIALTTICLISIFTMGLKRGIEYTGGTQITVSLTQPINAGTVQKAIQDSPVLSKMDLKEQIQPFNTVDAQGQPVYGMYLKTRYLNQDEKQEITTLMTELNRSLSSQYGNGFDISKINYDNIEASIGQELVNKAIWAVIFSTIGILLYVSFRFEFKSGVSAVLALIHDVIVVLGFASIFHIEVNGPFLAAVLTVVGYSINDTIVVYDRIRETLKFRKKDESFEDIVNNAIWVTLRRCIFTVLTVIISIIPLAIFVPTIREFTLPMLVGVTSGAYSSIFVASAIWIVWRERSEKKHKKPVTAKKVSA